MDRKLSFVDSGQAVKRFAAAIILVLFLFISIAEASACSVGFEGDANRGANQSLSLSLPSADSVDADSGQSGKTQDEEQAACTHGHCHHVGKISVPNLVVKSDIFDAVILGLTHDNSRPSEMVSRLKRPPRY